MFLLTACPNDDEDENSFRAGNEFVGLWKVVDFSNTFYLMLYTDGKIRTCKASKVSDAETSYTNDGASWTYNKETGVLATSASINSYNLQWEITLMSGNEWAGICLYDREKRTCKATKITKDSDIILMMGANRNWTNDEGSRLRFRSDFDDLRLDYYRYKWINGVNAIAFDEKQSFSYNRDLDQYELHFSNYVTVNRTDKADLIIKNPYSYSKVVIEGELDFYEYERTKTIFYPN